ncbi:MAG: DNA polymerase III subunit delta [Armatimonadota bacterium]|nr:DNA polymerase III subunit delta [Armatimonadota bacterium]MDR7451240.1 DNA polymerase III subunit delta [Armatimonadota bacterium]MDR7466857.1 DNA polymerase III subunit delta [Armatimonadota bacterium]MDR7492670.1 DNA polymerase III subunit delta [Armatimonadota bacterium]MDR7499599.1 DNA polymerase III subunit delta [Armatimonadota bacterium]
MAAPRAHVYLLLGEEDLLADQALAELLDRLVPPPERDLNLDVVRADEIAITDLITLVDTLPFFGQRRAVVVKDADLFKPADQDRLAAYLDRGAPPSALILVARQLDRRRRLYTTIRRLGEVQEFPRLTLRQLPAWVHERVRREGRRIDADAVDLLISRVGPGLRQLSLELEKLFAYVESLERITRRDVEATVSRTAESTIFTLVDAIGAGRSGQALQTLAEILREEAPPYVMFMIARHFRLLMRASLLRVRRRPAGAIQEALGVPPYVARKIMAQAEAFPPERFPAIFARLHEADRAIKSTGHPALALQTLIAELCLPPRQAVGGRS